MPFPFPWDLLDPGIEPTFPALAGEFFTTEPSGEPYTCTVSGNSELNLNSNASQSMPLWKLVQISSRCQEPQQGTGGKAPVPAGPTVWLEEADDKQAEST